MIVTATATIAIGYKTSRWVAALALSKQATLTFVTSPHCWMSDTLAPVQRNKLPPSAHPFHGMAVPFAEKQLLSALPVDLNTQPTLGGRSHVMPGEFGVMVVLELIGSLGAVG